MEPVLGKGMGFFVFRLTPDALRWKIRYAPCLPAEASWRRWAPCSMLLWGHGHVFILGFMIRDGLFCFNSHKFHWKSELRNN